MSSFEEKKILIEYNEKHYSKISEFITGFLIQVLFPPILYSLIINSNNDISL